MKLDDVLETVEPISGRKGGLFELDNWTESIGGWIVFLGSAAVGVWIVDAVTKAIGGHAGGLTTQVGNFVGRVLGTAPAAAAPTTAAAASADTGFYQ